jgi:hypothetical protein
MKVKEWKEIKLRQDFTILGLIRGFSQCDFKLLNTDVVLQIFHEKNGHKNFKLGDVVYIPVLID